MYSVITYMSVVDYKTVDFYGSRQEAEAALKDSFSEGVKNASDNVGFDKDNTKLVGDSGVISWTDGMTRVFKLVELAA